MTRRRPIMRLAAAAALIAAAPLTAPRAAAPPAPQAPAAAPDLRPYVRIALTGVIEWFKDPVIVNGEIKDIGTLTRTERGEYSIGSGTIITADGLVITNFHVIEDSFKPVIIDYNEKTKVIVRATPVRMLAGEVDPRDPLAPVDDRYVAEPLVWLEDRDIALVRLVADAATGAPLNRRDFTFAPLGNPYGIPVLAPLVVLGYPAKGGRSINPSTGPFQGFTWDVDGAIDGSIKTSAQISGGNSGGAALYNHQLVAIPTRVSLKEEKGADFGYLHPISWAAETLAYARLRWGTTVPRIETAWLESRSNTDDSRFMSYAGGIVVSGQSKLAVEDATVVVYRTDRTLEQIGQMDGEWSDLINAMRIQRLTKEGWTVEQIAERFEFTPAEVRAFQSKNVDVSKLSPDLQAFDRGEFFYESFQTLDDGFFFLKVPRGHPVRLAILKQGHRVHDTLLQPVTGLEHHAGKVQIFAR
jgi:hypothetical protein